MKDQHKKIKGYRDLSQQEIDLMNKIKVHGEKTKELLNEVEMLRYEQDNAFMTNLPNPECITQEQVYESYRLLGIAKEKLQTGQMWFVRAVALPDSF